MSKYKTGDKFVIEIGHRTVDPLYGATYFVKDLRNIALDDYGLDCLEQVNGGPTLRDAYDEGYEDGLRDAWECAKKAVHDVNIYEVFGTTILKRVWDMNPSEAIAKLKEYEAKQAEIKVGDIVRYNEEDGIITCIKDNCIYIIWKDGSAGEFLDAEKWFKKTGRHYDIDSILEQLKGANDEH